MTPVTHTGRLAAGFEPIRARLLMQNRRLNLTSPRTFNKKVKVSSPRTVWAGTNLAELKSVAVPPRPMLKPNHRSGLGAAMTAHLAATYKTSGNRFEWGRAIS
jgi:hypothetical protein